jgi:hypothetical protein
LNGASIQILQCQYLAGIPLRILTVKREMLRSRVYESSITVFGYSPAIPKMAASPHVYELNGQL